MIKYGDFISGLVGGSDGQVLFNDNDTIAGASTFYWDKVNNRVGIGTSTPASPLDVRGFNELIRMTATGGGTTIRMQNSFGSTWNVGSTGNDFYWLYNGVSSFMTLTSNGNLLINTTTDSSFKLDVNGSARATSYTLGNYIINQASANQFVVSNPSGPAGQLFLYGGNTSQANIQIFGSSGGNTNNISFNLGVTNRAVIFGSTGNFAINTTTDAGYKLDVNGTIRSSTGTSLINDSYFGDTLGPRIRVSGGAGIISCVYSTLGLSGGQSVSVGNNTFSIGAGGATNGTLTITTPAKVANTSETINLISSSMYYGVGEGRLVLQGANSVYSGSIGNVYLAGGRNSGGGNNGNTYLAYDLTGALGSVGIGTNSINASAITQIDSTTKGFLPPRMDSTQKNSISGPAPGLMIYDTTLNRPCFYNGTSWITL
jgi:hypothetical protein